MQAGSDLLKFRTWQKSKNVIITQDAPFQLTIMYPKLFRLDVLHTSNQLSIKDCFSLKSEVTWENVHMLRELAW